MLAPYYDTGTVTINVVAGAPRLSQRQHAKLHENRPRRPSTAAITVTDPNSTALAERHRLDDRQLRERQDVLGFVNSGGMGNIAGIYNSATGALTLTSAGRPRRWRQWQTALRAVTYFNSSDAPSTTARTVAFIVNDGTSNSNTTRDGQRHRGERRASTGRTVVTLASVNEDAGAPAER